VEFAAGLPAAASSSVFRVVVAAEVGDRVTEFPLRGGCD
jgi:hypothetical protein